MREQPEGQHLLSIARTTLLEKVVPALPQDQRYSALMVANALAIALRQWQAGDAWQHEELQRLQSLLNTDYLALAEGHFFPALNAANRALAQKIRKGEFDTPSQALTEMLEWMALQRVMESAPKALQPPSR